METEEFKSKKIGNHVWMLNNLNVDHFRNGDKIPNVTDMEEWSETEEPAWCYFENDPENGKVSGKLYNAAAIQDPRELAPVGWHIATAKEWEETINYLIEENKNSPSDEDDEDEDNDEDDEVFPALFYIQECLELETGGMIDENTEFAPSFSPECDQGSWWTIELNVFFWGSEGYELHPSLYKGNSYNFQGCSVLCIKDI